MQPRAAIERHHIRRSRCPPCWLQREQRAGLGQSRPVVEQETLGSVIYRSAEAQVRCSGLGRSLGGTSGWVGGHCPVRLGQRDGASRSQWGRCVVATRLGSNKLATSRQLHQLASSGRCSVASTVDCRMRLWLAPVPIDDSSSKSEEDQSVPVAHRYGPRQLCGVEWHASRGRIEPDQATVALRNPARRWADRCEAVWCGACRSSADGPGAVSDWVVRSST